ncbi:MAG: sugar ABC transporter ATP-binding protein [Spirochaetaceae bacterium]|jgi:ribose transport system ATP-binding protein|nr:sugar ABC transporter ATP-binding protein [Spirochaetaceae bacterium]
MTILSMKNISKSFFGVTVVNDVSFEVLSGEIHALLGENGAGKSTLMNILGGVYKKDSGEITVNGVKLENASVHESEKSGVAFVHQELNLFNDLLVFENLFLGKEIVYKTGTLNKKAMIARAEDLFGSLGVNINPRALTASLETSQKQLLEIAKSLDADAKLIILDEPTTALNTSEIEHLFSIVRRLKENGISFIFISHKMPEIFMIADRYTVLRNGRFIQSGKIADTNPQELTTMLVGREVSDRSVYEERALGGVILEMENCSGDGFYDVSLKVRKGEIIGLTGLAGSGASALIQALFGADRFSSGKVTVFGEEPFCVDTRAYDIHIAMKIARIGMVASNRKENSILPFMQILENQYVSEHTLSAFRFHIFKKKEITKYNDYKELLNIKANDHADLITSLSGGNQQKVILARLLNTNADIFLLDNPTQGIDVGAKSEIYKLILRLSEQGKTILVNTLEIPEIEKVADQCVVFYHGRIHAVLGRNKIDETTVMLHATGAVPALDNGDGQTAQGGMEL